LTGNQLALTINKNNNTSHLLHDNQKSKA